jgi:nitrite reductase/ring-hydroxylating ferredoxin subunit
MAPSDDDRRICEAAALVDGGPGRRFELLVRGRLLPAFVVRWRGRVYGYVNQCAHVAMELDWQPGQFFEDEGRYLMCATHGAIYEPASGLCVGGPCRGASLLAVPVEERDAHIWLGAGDPRFEPLRFGALP